jgi:hypothetical protein
VIKVKTALISEDAGTSERRKEVFETLNFVVVVVVVRAF